MPSLKRIEVTGNRLLDQLTADEFNRLASHLEPVSLAYKQMVHRPGEPHQEVLFPISGMLSLLVALEEGREVEVAMIGNEGLVGAFALLGVEASPYRVIAQAPTEALRMDMATFQRVLDRLPRLEGLVRRFLAVTLHNAHQLIACNALHPIHARLCRWLLMAHDRQGPECCRLTHEFLAEMLGVRRQTVTAASRDLQKREIVSAHRGSLKILNRAGLENAACECYRSIRAFQDSLLG